MSVPTATDASLGADVSSVRSLSLSAHNILDVNSESSQIRRVDRENSKAIESRPELLRLVLSACYLAIRRNLTVRLTNVQCKRSQRVSLMALAVRGKPVW